MAKPRRKSIKEKLDEYSEEIKGKTHNIFVKNTLESLLDDSDYLKVLEEVIIKSANEYKATHQNNNL